MLGLRSLTPETFHRCVPTQLPGFMIYRSPKSPTKSNLELERPKPNASKVQKPGVLGGSWVIITGVISPTIGVITITIVTLLITLLIPNPEPPSRP